MKITRKRLRRIIKEALVRESSSSVELPTWKIYKYAFETYKDFSSLNIKDSQLSEMFAEIYLELSSIAMDISSYNIPTSDTAPWMQKEGINISSVSAHVRKINASLKKIEEFAKEDKETFARLSGDASVIEIADFEFKPSPGPFIDDETTSADVKED